MFFFSNMNIADLTKNLLSEFCRKIAAWKKTRLIFIQAFHRLSSAKTNLEKDIATVTRQTEVK